MQENDQCDGGNSVSQKADKEAQVKLAAHAEVSIAGEPFLLVFVHEDAGNLIKAVWSNTKGHKLRLQDLAAHMKIGLPDFFQWELEIQEAALSYAIGAEQIGFMLDIAQYGKLLLAYISKKSLAVTLEINRTCYMKDLPVIGSYVSSSDFIRLDRFGFVHGNDTQLMLEGQIRLESLNQMFSIPPEQQEASSDKASFLALEDAPEMMNLLTVRTEALPDLSADGEGTSGGKITWLNINKSLKVLYLGRLGFSMEDSRIYLYMDASVRISVLMLEFYGLYLSIPLPHSGKVGFGLAGLVVSLDKPPLLISGGLYKEPGKTLYNGEIAVKIKTFSLTALASYGEEEDRVSFFIYMMLLTSIGGPPFFFVTGLAAGFGINRRLQLPELERITEFPFVQAALGKNERLKADTKPLAALNELSNWVTPAPGSYFISAGVKFTSFQMLESFALLSVEFGTGLRISLLGVSTLSLPPKEPPETSIAFAQLLLRAVYDDNQGYISIMAALTKESFILDRRCHLSGGFAFCAWLKGEEEGDFVVTLGGCRHPKFVNRHYPEIDPVGINWQITSELKLKGSAYFALTPACLMAGGDLAIHFDCGNLHAWFTASAHFLIQWKPLFYDIQVAVSLGASYTIKVWFIHLTIKLELGASLHLWGPEFAGDLQIKLFIITLTIHFGQRNAVKKTIEWDNFDKSFLPQENTAAKASLNQNTASASNRFLRIDVPQGLVPNRPKGPVFLVNAKELQIVTRSVLPCTEVKLNGRTIAAAPERLGVYPMGKASYTCIQNVFITFIGGEPPNMKCSPSLASFDPALWRVWTPQEPDINQRQFQNIPVGLCLTAPDFEVQPELPPYDSTVLSEYEVTKQHSYTWGQTAMPHKVDYSGEDVFLNLKTTFSESPVRQQALQQLHAFFGTKMNAHIEDIGKAPQDYYFSRPQLVTTGCLK